MRDAEIRAAQTEYDQMVDGPADYVPQTLSKVMAQKKGSEVFSDLSDWLLTGRVDLSGFDEAAYARIWVCIRGYASAVEAGREADAQRQAKRLADTCVAALEGALL